MEALGVSVVGASPAAAPSLIVSGRNNRRSVPTAQFAPKARQEERKCAGTAVPFRNGQTQTAKLAFATVLSAGFANVKSALAVSYDEVVGNAKEAAESINTDTFDFELPELDTSALTELFNSDPLAVLFGGAAIIAVPVILSTALKKPEGYGAVSAKQSFEILGDLEASGQLLDIRVEAEGSPDLKTVKKKVTRVPYSGEPEEYVTKVLKKFKDAENTTIYVLDQFDGESVSVAKLLAAGGFKAAYAIKGGAEGPGGWKASELPWAAPRTFNLDLGGIKELISSADSGSVLPATLGAAAAAGVGFVVFSEAETALQLLGSAALVQLFVKKFLFAEDRKRTIQELKTFLDTKVAPKEFVDELKEIGGGLLPKYEEVEAAASNGAALVESVAAETAATVEDKTSTLASEAENVASETAATVEDKTSTLASEAENVASETAATVEDKTSTLASEAENVASETAATVEDKTSTLASEAENVASETAATVEEKTSTLTSEGENVAAETTATLEDTASTVATQASYSISSPTKPKVEEKQEHASSTELPRTSNPLSPYAQYPGMKPPSSPTPSRP